jgi:hypothetical protein
MNKGDLLTPRIQTYDVFEEVYPWVEKFFFKYVKTKGKMCEVEIVSGEKLDDSCLH